MPIANLFSSTAIPDSVGTGRDGRDGQQRRGFEPSRHGESGVGTVGTSSVASPEPHPGRPTLRRGQGSEATTCESPDDQAGVPPHLGSSLWTADPRATCRRCGAHPQPLELGGFGLDGWSCDACLAAAGLLALARGAVVDDEAAALAEGPLGRVSSHRPRRWYDDRDWIADFVRAADNVAKLAVLKAWVEAAGGHLVDHRAMLPPLPRRLATLELRRILRQVGITIIEAELVGPAADERAALRNRAGAGSPIGGGR